VRQLGCARREDGFIGVMSWYYVFGDVQSNPAPPRELAEGTYDRELLAPGITLLPSAAIVRRSAQTRFPTWTTYCEDGI
jgi:hypothetical protein